MSIYVISAVTSTLIAVSYLVVALIVLPAIPRDELRQDLMMFGVAVLLIASARRMMGAVLVLSQAISLDEGNTQSAIAWASVSLSIPHALLAMAAAVWGLLYMRPHRVQLLSESEKERGQAADTRDQQANQREEKADRREDYADWREGAADHREGEADQRERDADKRERDE